ncbi:hypothetical protein NWF34_23010 [Gordonia sp. GONU]|uniref:hypothetical protein n=1 Tax=Gordonia sp. GONU TaxID=2972949 RepID=UPI0021ACB728|nr:hypothetical protein [Gordonia sp. GONU]MCR8899807.1 hypothetical protein [Gordonia sp. GONU]
MAEDILNWPRVGSDQRLYVCRPAERQWKGGLEDIHATVRGGEATQGWIFSGDDYQAGHLVLTIMQTVPMLVIGIDVPINQYDTDGNIMWEPRPRVHFRHGLPLDEVEAKSRINLRDLHGYLAAPDIRGVLSAMKSIHAADTGIFGSIP